MLSAFRKSPSATHDPSRPDITGMSYDLRRKFKLGVDYNMKILIRGDRNVGKSCLLARLQGRPFVEVYEPTDEIRVASVCWNYKATDVVVKLEMWDVVDQARRRRQLSAVLKLENSNLQSVEPALDASFVRVLQGANGVILMFDITKAWTWDYVKRELPLIPAELPVLVVGNKRDLASSRAVAEVDCRKFVSQVQLQRSSNTGTLYYSETSMLSGLGLKLIYSFLNVPFLLVERQSLTDQLNRNQTEMTLAFDELKLYDTVLLDNAAAVAVDKKTPVAEQNTIDAGKQCLQQDPNRQPSIADNQSAVVDLDSWLNDSQQATTNSVTSVQRNLESDEDEDGPNPLVTRIPTDDSGTEDEHCA